MDFISVTSASGCDLSIGIICGYPLNSRPDNNFRFLIRFRMKIPDFQRLLFRIYFINKMTTRLIIRDASRV
ncbi:MAG TPA: hypothetical protein DF409_07190 [Bacteroidales bacterium]|nr:hypothetical protein [Bacteroidales bacterium]